MNDALWGTLLLFGISLLVRILPSVVRLPLNDERQQNFRHLLPIAVFVNLVAYCFSSEAKAHPAEAVTAMTVLFLLLTFLPRVGVLLSVALSSAVYFLTLHLGAGGYVISWF